MPHRRKVEKGSFGGHFDELVKNFPEQQPPKSSADRNERLTDDRSVHDRLLEAAWRKATHHQ